MEGKKISVRELAKELGVEGKKLLLVLREMGYPSATAMKTLEAAEVKKIKKFLEREKRKRTD